MSSPKQAASHKRKGLTSPGERDSEPKRLKVADELKSGLESGRNATVPESEQEPANGSSTTHDLSSDEIRLRTDPSKEKTEKKDEADVTERRVSEAKRIALPATGRGNIAVEEKKRGKRLFGGLLNTLSQTASKSSNSQQKKRLEIERRQQEKAEQRRAEDDHLRVAKLAKLAHNRQIAQVRFDERVMETRHQKLRESAHFLRTKAEPVLYYLPARLNQEQEAQIDQQIQEATAAVEKEAREFKLSKERRLAELGVNNPPKRRASVGDSKPLHHTNTPSSTKASSKEPDINVPDEADTYLKEGDELVRDREDDVLY